MAYSRITFSRWYVINDFDIMWIEDDEMIHIEYKDVLRHITHNVNKSVALDYLGGFFPNASNWDLTELYWILHYGVGQIVYEKLFDKYQKLIKKHEGLKKTKAVRGVKNG